MALLNKVRHQVVKKGTSKTSVKQSLVGTKSKTCLQTSEK